VVMGVLAESSNSRQAVQGDLRLRQQGPAQFNRMFFHKVFQQFAYVSFREQIIPALSITFLCVSNTCASARRVRGL
jgi:hypothetical protein